MIEGVLKHKLDANILDSVAKQYKSLGLVPDHYELPLLYNWKETKIKRPDILDQLEEKKA